MRLSINKFMLRQFEIVFSDEEGGSFEYNLNVYAPTDSLPTMFEVPQDYKKVKKLKMF